MSQKYDLRLYWYGMGEARSIQTIRQMGSRVVAIEDVMFIESTGHFIFSCYKVLAAEYGTVP